ncbi:MAG: HPr family phosphocarrier protein [Oscillospiraceae bacterium]|nr:HPr family phosphocarrier protein [Oscillospiraceae bacterium]
MKEVFVYLPDPETVQRFVGTLKPLKGDFELVSENFILDARSLMGIFNLDLSRPILLRIYNDSPRNIRAISGFITEVENFEQ